MSYEYWGMEVPETLEERVDPRTSALVVVDMQNDFLHVNGHCARFIPVDRFASVVPTLQRLVDAAREAGVLVVFTKVVQKPDGSLASPTWIAHNLVYGDFRPDHCMAGTWGWEVVDELAPRPGDIVIEKTRRSAFEGTALLHHLRTRGIRTVVVTGVAGTGCVESTVRDAMEKDLFVVVPGDAIEDAVEDLHTISLQTFERILLPGDLTTVDALLTTWSPAPAPA